MNKASVFAVAAILMFGFNSSAHALIPNGDFETGDLTGYKVQEDFLDVASSPLVNNVDDGSGNHVGQIDTGFTDFGVTTATLARDFGALPADVQDLFFDVRFLDMGEDIPSELDLQSSPELSLLELLDPDELQVFFVSGAVINNPSFTLRSDGFTAFPGTEVENLSNGFYRVKTDISSFAGNQESIVFFDLRDGDDQRLSRVQIDNIDLTTADKSVVPEPATMLLMSGGLLGFGYLRRKKLV